jgi:hypothetical protein
MKKKDIVEIFLRDADASDIIQAAEAHGMRLVPIAANNPYHDAFAKTGDPLWAIAIELARSASVVLMPRGVAHGEHMGPLGARSFTITLKATFLNERERDDGQLEKWHWFHGGPVTRIMLSAYKEWLFADVATELGLNELLLKLPEAIGGEQEDRHFRGVLQTLGLVLRHGRADRNDRKPRSVPGRKDAAILLALRFDAGESVQPRPSLSRSADRFGCGDAAAG